MTTTIETVKREVPTFKSEKLNEYTEQIARSIDDMSANTMDIAAVLGTIKTTKCYTEDGFKSVADYAEAAFGMKKSMAYKLAGVGERFLNSGTLAAIPEISTMSASNLSEIANMTDEQITRAVQDGKITADSTQSELRDVANKTKAETESATPKVVKMCKLTMDSTTVEVPQNGVKARIEALARELYGDSQYNVVRCDNIIADDKTVERYVVVDVHNATAYRAQAVPVSPDKDVARKKSKAKTIPGDAVKAAIQKFVEEFGREPTLPELLDYMK